MPTRPIAVEREVYARSTHSQIQPFVCGIVHRPSVVRFPVPSSRQRRHADGSLPTRLTGIGRETYARSVHSQTQSLTCSVAPRPAGGRFAASASGHTSQESFEFVAPPTYSPCGPYRAPVHRERRARQLDRTKGAHLQRRRLLLRNHPTRTIQLRVYAAMMFTASCSPRTSCTTGRSESI